MGMILWSRNWQLVLIGGRCWSDRNNTGNGPRDEFSYLGNGRIFGG